LPLAIAGCTLVCLLLGAPPAYAVWTRAESSLAAQGWLALLLGLYLTAGLVWGLHRTVRCGATAGLAVLDGQLPEVLEQLLAPLAERGEERLPSIEIAQARRCIGEASEGLLDLPLVSRWRWLRRLTLAAARWWLRAELVVVEQVLSTLEQRGESKLSLASLTACVRDQLVVHTRRLVDLNLGQLDWLAAAVVFGLLVLPAALLMLVR
jgi:hypothetical protein